MSSVTYDDLGFPDNYYTNGVQDLSMDFDDETGNLLSRTDHLKGQEETFDYDQTDRFTKAQVENLNTNTMQTPLETSYQNNGNIASKSDAGEYTYDNNKPNAVVNIESNNTTLPTMTQNVSYTQFDRPASIQEGNKQLVMHYNENQNRIKTEHYENSTLVQTKLFFGRYEEVTENGTTQKFIICPYPGEAQCSSKKTAIR